MPQLNRNHVVSWHQGANGLVSLYLLCFSIYSIKTPAGRNELVVKALGWSGLAHLLLFPSHMQSCLLAPFPGHAAKFSCYGYTHPSTFSAVSAVSQSWQQSNWVSLNYLKNNMTEWSKGKSSEIPLLFSRRSLWKSWGGEAEKNVFFF